MATFYGDTKSETRQEIVNEFQDKDSSLRFLLLILRQGLWFNFNG